MIVFVLWRDLQGDYQMRRLRLLRASLRVQLGEHMWDVMFASNLIVDWLEEATEEEVATFRTLEGALLEAGVGGRAARDTAEVSGFNTMAKLDLFAVDRVMETRLTGGQLQASAERGLAAEMKRHRETLFSLPSVAVSPVPTMLCLVPAAHGALLEWISETADNASLRQLSEVISRIRKFEALRSQRQRPWHSLVDGAQDVGHEGSITLRRLKQQSRAQLAADMSSQC